MSRSFLVALLSMCIVGSVAAQNTDIEALSGLQFNFGNPGARSLAMGGAFIGLADDASATEGNPAGLTILRRPEVSVEMRNTRTAQYFDTGGWYPNVTTKNFPASDTSISFASVVFPIGKFAGAVYYHQPLRLQNSVDTRGQYPATSFFMGPNGPLTREECATRADCVEESVYPYATSADVELKTYGVAFAWGTDRMSIGVALRDQEFREIATTVRADLDAVGAPQFIVTERNGGHAFGSSDHDITWIAGLKWKPTENVGVGAVYKKGARFPAPVWAGAESSGLESGLILLHVTHFHVPDLFGVGVSWRPSPLLALNVDVDRVSYSDLASEFVSVAEVELVDGQVVDYEGVHGFEADDATEIHVGIEYFLSTKVPIAIRAGWWRDPAHSIVYRGPLTVPHEVAAAILFPERSDDDHFSLGMGFAFPRWQLDAGYDGSSNGSVASLSAVVRF